MQVNRFKERVDSLLLQGISEFSMTLGVLARIENNNYEIVAVQSNSGAYVSGEKYELGDSFCRKVFESQEIIAETRIDNSPLSMHHPLYRSLPLESYIGAPISIHGEPWGCVNFSSMAQQDEAFGQQQIEFIDKLAAEISQLISSGSK
jgi:GAF domain-containing protein